MESMGILLTNDDGIDEKGLYVLRDALMKIDNVIVVAPDSQRSASSHSISIADFLRVEPLYLSGEFLGYKVSGTPADCVKIALCELLNKPPAAVVSGINRGPNTGVSVYYSGTVSAAREGAIAGIPSVAVSMCSFEYDNFDFAAEIAANTVERFIKGEFPSGLTLNINIPPLDREEIKGIKITKQANSRFIERYNKTGGNSYRLTGELYIDNEEPDDDEYAVNQGYVSITPLKLDMTDYSFFNKVKDAGLFE